MKRSQIWQGLAGITLLMVAIISGCTRSLTTAPVAAIPTATNTAIPIGNTSTATRTSTRTNTATPTNTVAGNTATSTATITSTSSPTVTATQTNSNTNVPGATDTFTSTTTLTPTVTLTSTATASATTTNTNVPGATSTSTATTTATTATCKASTLQTSYTFDSSLECWMIDSADVTKATSLDISTTQKHSGTSSMHAVISNVVHGQAQLDLQYAAGQDFTGKGITAWVYVDASMVGASVQVYSLSGATGGTWGAGGWTDFSASNVGKWVQVSYTLTASDISQVQQIGLQFYNLTAATTGNVYIDDVKIADSCSASSVISNYTFDTSTQCWHVDSGSAGIVTDLGISSTTTHTGAGAMYASVVNGSTSSTVQLDLSYSPPQNLTGMTYSAWIYVPTSFIGCSAQLFMQNANAPYTWVNSPAATNFDATNTGKWVQLTFTPTWTTADSNTVGTIGIQFLSVPANATGTVYVDDINLTAVGPTSTPTITATSVDTPTVTETPTITDTTIPGSTDTYTFTVTATPTVTATSTATSAVTSTNTPQSTPTACQGIFQAAYTFDSSVECWALDSVSAPAVTTYEISSTQVNQGTGAMHIGFTEPATSVNLQVEETYSTAADLSGRTISAWVYADPSMLGGGVQLFCQSGGWNWSNSTGVYLGAAQVGKWIQVSWQVAGTDPTTVNQIGIQFYGIPAGATGNIYVDNITFSTPATPTNTPSGACTPILLNDCESLTSNGTWGGSNSAFSISPLHATQGSNSLDVSIVTPPAGGWNDQFIQLSGFSPNTWTNSTQLVMDMYVDASVLAGTTYNQMFLEASTGGGPWKYIGLNQPSLVAGANSVTFNLDWTGAIAATNPLDMMVLVLQTGGTSGTGNIYVDNVHLTQSCP